MDEMPIFKSSKRRKLTRPRDLQEVDQEAATQNLDDTDVTTAKHDQDDDESPKAAGVSGVIKARALRRPVGGVQFSTARPMHHDGDDNSFALRKLDADEDKRIDIGNRFVGSTGHVVNDDKHMFVFLQPVP
jgi:hypothetical protein